MHAGCSSFNNHVTLTFDHLTSSSMHAEVLPWSIRVPSLVLVAQVVFLSERRHTHIHTKSRTPLITLPRVTSKDWAKCHNYTTFAKTGGAS